MCTIYTYMTFTIREANLGVIWCAKPKYMTL